MLNFSIHKSLLIFLVVIAFDAVGYGQFGYAWKWLDEKTPTGELDSAAIYLNKSLMNQASVQSRLGFINTAIEWSLKNNKKDREVLAYLRRGRLLAERGSHETAIQDYQKGLDIGTGDQLLTVELEAGLLESQIASGKMVEANNGFNKLSAKQLNGITSLQRNYLVIWQSQTLNRLNRSSEAKSLIQELLGRNDISSSIRMDSEIVLCEIFLAEKNYTGAQECMDRAMMAKTKGDEDSANQRLNDLQARIYREQSKFDLESQVLMQSIETGSNVSNSNSVMQNFQLGNAFLNANDYRNAEKYLLNGTEQTTIQSISPSNDFVPLKSAELQVGANSLKRLAESYLQTNETKKALEFYKRYATLQDSVYKVKERELEEAINLSTELGKNTERIELLEKEKSVDLKSIELLEKEKEMQSSKIATRNTVIGLMFASFLALVGAVYFVIRNRKAKERADKLLVLQSLGGQMNPHFVFNALNSVNEYVAGNNEREANRYLTAFSRLMRKVLDDSRNAFIPIANEIEMLELYLQLEHARFSDKFNYSIEVEDELRESDVSIPPMMVQPFIENAVWHGLRYRNDSGELKITFSKNENNILIAIRDNGIGMKKSAELKTSHQKGQRSVAIQNIRQRIELFNKVYQKSIQLNMSPHQPESEYPGTLVELKIPIS